ncbi:uncharacterized protein LOC118733065 [Rhagoletis pomonella]|uniref:uncharacterized protein LOC118733065 n=1 Tax=Rhagoletis pomonella TaxID=28610 RepID=UPI00177EB191|nr:uncharacterized protein LOC118733065 [Rhagoletis pomonella]
MHTQTNLHTYVQLIKPTKTKKIKMCLSSSSGSGMQNDQIRKFVEHGMPEKIVKTVQYTLRKRAAERNSTVASMEISDQHMGPYSTAAAETKNPRTPDKTGTLGIPRLCGRFRNLQTTSKSQDKITNIGAAGTDEAFAVTGTTKPNHTNKIDMDALAITTQMTKHFVQQLHGVAEKMQSSKLYRMLTSTAQPAHLIAVCVLIFVLFTVWPDIVDTRNSTAKSDAGGQALSKGGECQTQQQQQQHHTLAVIAYLAAFATHFGAQIWMTFISGLSLYFQLPRHTFGQCQQILFPRYFALSSALSIIMLVLFVKYFLNSWNLAALIQLTALGATASIELIIRLYLAPPMLRLMHEKYRIEGAIGSGREVGSLEQGDLISCPHYQRIHKTFRRIHMTIAMGNMTVLLATCLHLYFLASKIQIS